MAGMDVQIYAERGIERAGISLLSVWAWEHAASS